MSHGLYPDGISAKYFENSPEDWGLKELDKHNREVNHKAMILHARDHLSSIIDLISVCREALVGCDDFDTPTLVGNVMHFTIEQQLRTLDEELSKICHQLK